MSEIEFAVTEVTPVPYAAAPTLAFRLHLEAPAGETIHSIALRCQIRIEPQRRRYSAEEEAGLLELFGETPRWGDTLKPFLWTHASAMVLGFTGTTGVDLHVPCTYDLDVAGAKYFHALGDGEIPLLLLFSGTVFAKGEGGALRVTQIPWDKEARYRLPVRVWRELIDRYFPNAGWLRLRRDILDALLRVKARRALLTWDDVLAELLRAAGEEAA
jgi:Family of unknown function (DUF6084)